MDTKDLKDQIKKGESDTFEFKESFNEEAIQTLGAFANTNGGNVFIGVDQSGEIKGMTLPNQHHQPIFFRILLWFTKPPTEFFRFKSLPNQGANRLSYS